MVSMNCSNKGIRKILVTNGACLISGNTFILHSSTRTLFCGNNYIKKLPLLKNTPCIIPSPVNKSYKLLILLLFISMFGPIKP